MGFTSAIKSFIKGAESRLAKETEEGVSKTIGKSIDELSLKEQESMLNKIRQETAEQIEKSKPVDRAVREKELNEVFNSKEYVDYTKRHNNVNSNNFNEREYKASRRADAKATFTEENMSKAYGNSAAGEAASDKAEQTLKDLYTNRAKEVNKEFKANKNINNYAKAKATNEVANVASNEEALKKFVTANGTGLGNDVRASLGEGVNWNDLTAAQRTEKVMDHFAANTDKYKDMQLDGNMIKNSIRTDSQIADDYIKQRSASPTWGDKMGYHKVPQKAVGFGGTAYLISSMSGRKGQQSNSELYGQSSSYGR